jgi:hypothetical protein
MLISGYGPRGPQFCYLPEKGNAEGEKAQRRENTRFPPWTGGKRTKQGNFERVNRQKAIQIALNDNWDCPRG